MFQSACRLLVIILFGLPSVGLAQTWDTYRKDTGRSGFVEAEFDPGFLQRHWKWESPVPPDPAWDGPARWDAFAELRDLPAMRQYDACFHPVSDGEMVYFGSSSQNSIFAFDIASGKKSWSFVTDGPIRIAPTVYKNSLLFGSDDGNAYCLNKKTGELTWNFNPSKSADAEQRRVLNNDRLISFYPIRTGIVVRDETAYFAASFLPWRESYICGVDVETGKISRPDFHFLTRHEKATLEGPLLVADDRLIVPQGRIAPLMFDRKNGKQLGTLPGGGGVTIVLTSEGVARTEGGRSSRPGSVGVFKGKERVASFPRGRSIVVRKNGFYVIDREKIFAASRKNELRWQRELVEPLELIMVGSSLVVGRRDGITVLNAKDGQVVWETELNGRVFGLAYAAGSLLASTDTGQVHCFRAKGTKKWQLPQSKKVDSRKQIPVTELESNKKDRLLHRWVFHRSAMKKLSGDVPTTDKLSSVKVLDQVGNATMQLKGQATSISLADKQPAEAIELQNSMFPIDEKLADSLPTKNLTVEAWVRVDQPATWGGIVGCIQDDGSTEHGWLLGYNNDRFSFAVAGSKSGLTYLKADRGFKKRNWYHVVGTYDGSMMKLYVDGRLMGSSSAEKGPISYAKKKYFTVGAYRDANESFPLKGGVHEIRIYDSTLSIESIKKHYESKKDFFPEIDEKSLPQSGQEAVAKNDSFIKWGPYVRYIKPGVAEVTFGTRKPMQCVLSLRDGSKNPRSFKSQEKQSIHKIVVDDLPFKRILNYVIQSSADAVPELSREFSLDTHFDWSPSNVANSPSNSILSRLPNPRGVVLVLRKEHAEFAKSLALTSSQTVILVEPDAAAANTLRRKWIDDRKLKYGQSLTVITTPIDQLPAAFAQLVVKPNSVSDKASKGLRRLVRPSGGILSDGKRVVWQRGKVAGAGEWTHMYGSSDNSAYGGEHLGEASNREDLVANWIGRPGPRYQTDRQNRKPSPLAANGRLFLQGQQRMIALDSHSGSILWSVETPTVMRWNIPRDSSNWCADKDGIYVAAESEAWFIDGATGQLKKHFQIPADILKQNANGREMAWGYLARHQDLLLGSIVPASAVYTKWWGKTQWFDSPTGGDTHVVVCKSLFAVDKESGESKWNYDGLVLHPTITIQGNRIYFVEDKTLDHLDKKSGRVSLDKNQNHQLVCLDASNGKVLFEKKLDAFQGKVSVLYLAGGGSPETLVMVASEATRKEFSVTRFNPENGEKVWGRAVKWEANHHGKHISRPALENDLLYIRPEVIKLADGKTIKRGFPPGHGCSSYTLSKNGLFSRLGETTWWDVRNDKVNRFSRVRTDCWISAIPAQGMLLSAEGGGGCSCGSWLETSIGFLPRKIDQEVPEEDSRKE